MSIVPVARSAGRPTIGWVVIAIGARDPHLVEALYGPLLEPRLVNETREMFARYAKNPALPRPLGSANSPGTVRLHRIAEVLKWGIPAVLVLLGSAIVL